MEKKKPAEKAPTKKPTPAKKAGAKKAAAPAKSAGGSASELIDARVASLGDWRGEMFSRLRALVRSAVPDVEETWKWRGTPVWERDGMICTGETYKNVVKLTFAKGAALPDPARLFNSSLEGNVRRAIDFHEGDPVNERALTALVRAAVALNQSKSKGKKPRLLSGGNPQIPKGDGDAPVRAYIAAMPGWKRAAGRELDALVERTVPGVTKAVKWNSPMYGLPGRGFFLAYHCFERYIKVTFFFGSALTPKPPVGSKDPNARYVHVFEDARENVDEAQLADWIRQAAARPGWSP